jgi:hypothetical protein
VPEQEFLPPRPPDRFHRPGPGPDGPPGYPGEGAPPWAGLPPVRPARPGGPRPGPADPGYPAGPGYTSGSGHPADPGYPGGSWPPGLPGPQPPPGPDGSREEEQVPQWAGPDVEADDEPPRDQPAAPGGRAGRSAPGRRARRAARRRRRWLIMLAGLAVVAGGVTAAVVVPGGPAPAPVTPGALITTFQPGELQTVPDACQTVPAATVQRYLPGPVKQAAPLAIDGTAESVCNWTIDRAPVYRLLELDLLAYAPNGLASGDGSATNAAMDAYAQALRNLRNPPRHSADPRATVSLLGGLGNEAFSATQVFRRGGAVTDVVTVVVRFHNVIVTATLNGLEHSNQGNYGPVSQSELSAAALAFAQAAEAALH